LTSGMSMFMYHFVASPLPHVALPRLVFKWADQDA